LRYVFRPEDALGKSHNLLSINAFKIQGVDSEYEGNPGITCPASKTSSGSPQTVRDLWHD